MIEYMIIRAFDDNTCTSEKTTDFSQALNACAIYAQEPEIFTIKIVDTSTGKLILDWYK